VHQVGDQPRLFYDARSTSHQEVIFVADVLISDSGV